MKAKIDSDGTLHLEAESEIEAYALDCWIDSNLTGIGMEHGTVDFETSYRPEESES